MRIFIIQHDCGHGSFFKSRKANDVVGSVCSLFTLVSYRYWRKAHAVHHADHAELEERGIGDVWTMTVDEYLAAPWWKKTAYRVFRNPFFLFGIAPGVNFLILERFPLSVQKEWHSGERASVWWTDFALAGLFIVAGLWLGFGAVLAILLPVTLIAASVGTWLFYVQHQFERTYWEHTPEWDYTLAAMHGSSYYELPKLLQWFTGNIGFHHIHHLSPRIPNYNLEKCHVENPLMQRVVRLTISSSLQSVSLALWDEDKRRLVTFGEAQAGRGVRQLGMAELRDAMTGSENAQPPHDSSPLDAMMRRVIGDIDDKQIAAARGKVAGLRARHPQATPDETRGAADPQALPRHRHRSGCWRPRRR